ncbi:hypothetical protein GGR26_000699 [Lewinella marina]|uniref:LVIVD repeat-containing protein n=1 Tax=Neolewinella marina TaxID=438751 RepID=A0A2G0CIT0_9BACT|nr:hypothetical protein [Neolewinella marina]NJB84954.1 hypothetical protein [Neolewinella marina]PHK99893.1 hypothetical protein CGL56_02285 [Neolewinella marina]
MKHLLTLLCCTLLLTGCLEEECTDVVTYTAYHPVVLTAAEWRSDDFSTTVPQQVCDPSAFYVYGDILFVLDRNAGLHLIDNSDNAAPRPLKFMNIPGGVGLAVRNNILYVNQYIDLLAFDLSDPANPEFLSRTKDVFDPYTDFAANLHGTGDVTVAYTEGTETMQVDCNSPFYGRGWMMEDGIFFTADRQNLDFAMAAAGAAGGSSEQVGTGGSLARFTINRGTLYAVDESSLRTFSLANPTEPEFMGITRMPWGIETIFPYKNMLFMGANNGMHIYGIDNPLQPEYLSTFAHVLSCDPVVVQNDIAYVTMWGGADCGNRGDQLSVIDVSDPRDPRALQEIPMSNSHGLGVDGDHLFLCSGPEGLKVYDLTDDGRLGAEVHQATDFPAKDVIVLPARRELIVLGWEQAGIRQYDYDDTGRPAYAADISICN